jgi:hypothetical protein
MLTDIWIKEDLLEKYVGEAYLQFKEVSLFCLV